MTLITKNIELRILWKMDADEHQRLESDLLQRSSGIVFLESFVGALIFLVAFCGNFLICWIIYKKKHLRTIPNYYIVSLAISDILLSLLVLPAGISVALAGKWIFGNAICQFQGFVTPWFAYVSILTITLTAVNRYFKVVRPRKYRKYYTPRSTLLSIISAWVLACFGSVPYLAKGNEFIFHPGKLICAFDLRRVHIIYTSLAGTAYFVCPSVIIIFCYWKVFHAVSSHKKRFTRSVKNCNPEVNTNTAEINVTKTLFAIVLGFALCYVQVFVIELLGSFIGQFALPRQVYVLYFFMASISSAVNPVIYGILNPSFKTELKKLLICTRIAKTQCNCREGNVENGIELRSRRLSFSNALDLNLEELDKV